MTPIIVFLLETKLGRGIAIGVAVFIGIMVGWLTFKTHYYNQGWNAAVAAVAARNKEATDAVNQAIQSIDSCTRSNGTWDQSSGMCIH